MSSATEETLVRLVDRIECRYYGKYRGFVTDNDDPDRLGRVRAKVPRLLGDEETGWALPAFAYGGASEQGLFAVPDREAGVWIEFEEGSLNKPLWSGTWYTGGAIPESSTPSKKVFKTKSGHKIILDDDGNRLEITDSNGNSIVLEEGDITVNAGSAAKIIINAPKIELVENAAHPLVLGDSLLKYLNQLVQIYASHTHPGELALGVLPVSPAPPIPPMPPATPDLLSQRVTTD
jgi:hypothetical protein